MTIRLTDRKMQLTLLVAASAVALCLSACGIENVQAFAVVGNAIPDDSCTVKAQGGGGGQQAFVGSGVLDLAVGDQYVGFLMVNNQFPQFESSLGFQSDSLRLEPGDITVDGIQVTLKMDNVALFQGLDPAEQQQLLEYWTSLGLSAEAQSFLGTQGTQFEMFYERPAVAQIAVGGTGVVIVDVIPSHIGRALRALPYFISVNVGGQASIESVAEIHIVGRRGDGKKVKSGLFRYPILLCNRCLVLDSFPTAFAQQPTLPNSLGIEPLDAATALAAIATGNIPCTGGADDAVTNAYCGVAYPLNSCQQNRCLGLAGGANLTCPNDGLYVAKSGLVFAPGDP